VAWHPEGRYEQQPSSTTILYLLDGLVAGGDTLFVNQAEAYWRLSPEFRKLHGLKDLHSGMTTMPRSLENPARLTDIL
jgi:sulfonate dioxygenase